MTEFWLDNHLSPAIAPWMQSTFIGVTAHSVRNLERREASDRQIFELAFARMPSWCQKTLISLRSLGPLETAPRLFG